jgi:hypothetical protein
VLHLKDLRDGPVGKKVTGSDEKILRVFEGPHGGGAWFAGHERNRATIRNHYSTLVPYVKGYL